MISGERFIDVLIPVDWKKLCYFKYFFIHNTHWYKNTGQKAHAKRNNIGKSIEHVAVFYKKPEQIRQRQRDHHHHKGIQEIIGQNTGSQELFLIHDNCTCDGDQP